MELQSKEDKLTANNKFLLLNLQQLKLLSLQDVRIPIIQLQSLWEDRWAVPHFLSKNLFCKAERFSILRFKSKQTKRQLKKHEVSL